MRDLSTPGSYLRAFALLLLIYGQCLPCQAASSYAIVIGISRYHSTNWPYLPNGRSDAEHMAAALSKQGFAVRSFLDSGATRQNIDAYIEDELAPKLTKADRVLFFFAGHGATQTNGSQDFGFIVPYDATEAQSSWISMGHLRELSAVLNAAHHQLFILDSCFGGLLVARGQFLPHQTPNYIAALQTRISRTVITAGGKDQRVADSGVEGQSLFVHEFIRALEVADVRKTGYVTVTDIFHFIQHAASTAEQTPVIGTLPGDESGEMIFASPYYGTGSTVRVGISPESRASVNASDLLRSSAGVRAGNRIDSRTSAAENERNAEMPKPGQTFRDCLDGSCPWMVVTPPGSFQMGSRPSEIGRGTDEGPVHTVRIDYALAVGKYPITRGEWRRYLSETHGSGSDNCFGLNQAKRTAEIGQQYTWLNPGFIQEENHPVVCVTWQEAQDYVTWLAKKTGHHYRLLSEAEYEYLERAGTDSPYPWGATSDAQCEHTNAADATLKAGHGGPRWSYATCRDNVEFTSSVDHFPPNDFGLYDMDGNAASWVQDCYHENYPDRSADGSARESANCTARVVRGAAWSYDPVWLRSAYRFYWLDGRNFIGLRVARSR